MTAIDLEMLGHAIRRRRVAARLGQHELARRAGTSQSQLSKWERGVNAMSVVNLAEIAGALGVDAGELLGDASADGYTGA